MTHPATILASARRIDLTARDLPAEVPPGHVRLALATASLCGTDLHYFRHFANAGFVLQRPVTLGHEGCARVTDPNGSGLAVGQLVALNPIIACGDCEFCAAGQENHCTAKRFPGSATTVPHIDGFFQAAFDFPAACCYPAPLGIEPDHLTFAEPLACAMHAAMRAEACGGMRVLVTGCGPMGLLAVIAARARGAEVHATDIRAEAVALARRVGAAEGFHGEAQPPALAYDAVIEASGSPHAFNLALEAVRKQGILSILSTIQPSEVPINLHRIMLKEIAVHGSFQFNAEFRQAIELIARRTPDFDALIAARFPLSRTGEALDYMLAGKAAGKILIRPEG